MTLPEFRKEMAVMFAYWPAFKVEDKREMVSVWYSVFRDYPAKQFHAAVEDCSRNSSEYFPTLPQVKQACGEPRTGVADDVNRVVPTISGICYRSLLSKTSLRCGCLLCRPQLHCSDCGMPLPSKGRRICIYCGGVYGTPMPSRSGKDAAVGRQEAEQ